MAADELKHKQPESTPPIRRSRAPIEKTLDCPNVPSFGLLDQPEFEEVKL